MRRVALATACAASVLVMAIGSPAAAPPPVRVAPATGTWVTTFTASVRWPSGTYWTDFSVRGPQPAFRCRRDFREVGPKSFGDGTLMQRRAQTARYALDAPTWTGWCPGRHQVRVSIFFIAKGRRGCPPGKREERAKRCYGSREIGRAEFRVRPRPKPSRVRVPRLIGMESSDAECLLARRMLRWRYEPARHSRRKPRFCPTRPKLVRVYWEIVSQRPSSGRVVRPQSVVQLAARCVTPPELRSRCAVAPPPGYTGREP